MTNGLEDALKDLVQANSVEGLVEDGGQQMMGPFPVPTMVQVNVATGPDGTKMAVLEFRHPTGISVFFLDMEASAKLGKGLIQASTGIVLPPK
jgi:hypothetical protein